MIVLIIDTKYKTMALYSHSTIHWKVITNIPTTRGRKCYKKGTETLAYKQIVDRILVLPSVVGFLSSWSLTQLNVVKRDHQPLATSHHEELLAQDPRIITMG